MKPTIGRIIHVEIANRHLAAIVTDEPDASGKFQAHVFAPAGFFVATEDVTLHETGTGDLRWHWPERVDG